jgi:hypothetical protein
MKKQWNEDEINYQFGGLVIVQALKKLKWIIISTLVKMMMINIIYYTWQLIHWLLNMALNDMDVKLENLLLALKSL